MSTAAPATAKQTMPILRSRENPLAEIDWSGLGGKVTKIFQITIKLIFPFQEVMSQVNLSFEDVEKDFDTRIGGLWMKRWPITHHNRHTDFAGIPRA